MKSPGFLGRMLRRRRHEGQGGGDSKAIGDSPLDLAEIRRVCFARLQNADGAALLAGCGVTGTSAPTAWAAREWRRIRRPPSHDRRGLARGIRAWTARRSRGSPASQARLLPQHRFHVARIGGARGRGTDASVVVQVIWRVHRRGCATCRVGGRYGPKFAPELDWRFRDRRRSCLGDAARHQPGGDDELQRDVVCLVC